jgi:hypothetical protein
MYKNLLFIAFLILCLIPSVSSYDEAPYSFNVVSNFRVTGDVTVVASSENRMMYNSDALKSIGYEALRVTALSANFQKESDGTNVEWFQLNARPGITSVSSGLQTDRTAGFGTAQEYRYQLNTHYGSSNLMDGNSGLMGVMVMSQDGNAFSIDTVGRGLQTMFGFTSFSDETRKYMTREFNTVFTNSETDEINFQQGLIAQINEIFFSNATPSS